METLMKGKRGITLIALVITIIILLILAGVSIAMLTGENGILSQAQKASEETGKASVIEQAKLDILAKQSDGEGAIIYKEEIREILDKYFKDVTDDFTLDTELQTRGEYGDYQILVSEIYNGELIERAVDVLKVDKTATNPEDKSPFVKYKDIICRVLYNDEKYGLQIVSVNNVEDVKLGDTDSLEKSREDYNNAVNILNNIAKGYMDENAIDARSLGSIAELEGGKFQGDTSGIYSSNESQLENYEFKDADTNYEEDINQIDALELNITTSWLASRNVNPNSGSTNFRVRYLSISGNSNSYNLCEVGNLYENCNGYTIGLRPVFLLSSDAIIASGDGSEGNPYIIE